MERAVFFRPCAFKPGSIKLAVERAVCGGNVVAVLGGAGVHKGGGVLREVRWRGRGADGKRNHRGWINFTYTCSGSWSSRLSICPLGTNPALASSAWAAVFDALVDANSLGD